MIKSFLTDAIQEGILYQETLYTKQIYGKRNEIGCRNKQGKHSHRKGKCASYMFDKKEKSLPKIHTQHDAT